MMHYRSERLEGSSEPCLRRTGVQQHAKLHQPQHTSPLPGHWDQAGAQRRDTAHSHLTQH